MTSDSQSLHLKARAWLARTDPDAIMMETGARNKDELDAISVAEQKRKADQQAQMMECTTQDRIAEYHARGLEPIYADAAKTIVVSLPMMLRLGARIENVNGVPTLIRP